MGISDSRRKGKGCKEIHLNYVLVWSGVEQNQRATHGVGFILHPDTAKNLTDTVCISERIIKITIRDKDNTTNYFQVYAPCNDSYTEEEKDRFFEQLSDSISLVADEEEIVVMGDFNGRVGRRRDPWTAYLGPHSDRGTECNYNGHQLLSLCAEFDLVITNTLYQHRPSHTQTWYRWSDMTVSSQIDFILTKASRITTVQDARAVPNAGLDTDHRPVLMSMTGKTNWNRRRKLTHEPQINLNKLRKNMDIQEEIKRKITERLEQEDTRDKSAEETWCIFRDTLLDCLKNTCGKKRHGKGQRKATKWWNDEVKEAVREKKRLYKVWVKSQTQEDYVKYRLARRKSKREVKHAKDASWKTYGQELSELCKRSPREFYRSVKAMRLRDEPYNPTPVINDQDGNPIYEEDKIKQRWEQYFRDLLNPVDENSSHIRFNPSYPEHTEPNILEEEVRRAVKTSPKNKAAGVDGIPVEAITACGETGIRWLTNIFQKVWVEQCVPEDWRKSVVIPIWKKKGDKKECSTYRDREIETRIQKANSVNYQLAPLLKHPNIPMETKARLINAIFVPTLTYQCQTWTLNRAQERKLTSCEMRVLRRAAGKTRRDRLRNEVVRELVGTKPVLQFIAKQRVQWFGHLMRLPTTQPALRAYTTRHSGVRARGRPRRRWIEGVAETVRAHGLTLLEATHLAQDRCLHLPATPPQA
ncbi:uncharacterized protein LOC118408089 [Branchiostoma floridae]|uniref:Uncharacterized protein LOC118408089 n=1 Tax=Branchiostoma floridae TaxID=7739 RepID=A0A9J7HSB1_BRAFL|nr:uncharacterized protein LOC118408089 [Branchiostoma floridae]